MDLKDYQRLKQEVEDARRQRDRAKGALDQLHQQLRKEFGVGSLEEAQTLLQKLTEEEKALDRKASIALRKFESKYHKHLGE